MKKMLLSLCIVTPFALTAQYSVGSLQVNQVRPAVVSNGDLFWDYTNARYEVPAGSGKHTIFSGAMWIGGLDGGGQLHMAGQTYRQAGNDFFNGPVSNPSQYNSTFDNTWAVTWNLRRSMIDSFRLGLYGVNIPAQITNWPGNGNTSIGQAAQLAPYIDVNTDGIYNPAAGDYPCIKGDEATFLIYNDDRNTHTETGGQKLGIEVHAMLYGFKRPGQVLDSTVFINYKIYNRSSSTYHDVYLGQWLDFDLGYFADDYVGTDVENSMFYVYNGDANDGTSPNPGPGTYGANPPAQGAMLIHGPDADTADGLDNNRNGTVDESGEDWQLSNFMYYNNDFTVHGNPATAADHYAYLKSYWLDGTPLTYGGNGYTGSTACTFMFPGSSDPLGWGTNMVPQAAWDEASSNNIPGDRRGVGSCGPFEFAAGEVLCVEYALIYARGATQNNQPSVVALQNAADSIRNYYDHGQVCNCSAWGITGISENTTPELHFGLYPNPAVDVLTVTGLTSGEPSTFTISDMNGKTIAAGTLNGSRAVIDVASLPRAVYTIRVVNTGGAGVQRFVK